MPESAPKGDYTRGEVLRLLKISERQLRAWERSKLIQVSEFYGFTDIVALKTLIKLRESRVPAAKIRLAVEAIRKKLLHVADPLKELRVYSEGKRVRVEISGQQMEPMSGQLLFNFDQKELKRLLSFPGKGKGEQKAQRDEAERWFQKGLEFEHTGAPIEQAIQAYESATRLDPNCAGALVNLGTIRFNAKDFDKAEQFYRRALEIDQDYPLAHFNMANLYDERGEYAKAMKHYQAAVRLNPQYADAHYNLALLFQGNGQTMEAVRHWKAYLKLDPSSAWGAIARRELGKLRQSALVKGRSSDLPHSSG